MKQCKKCGVCTDAFSIEKMNKDGLRGACKNCVTLYNQGHYLNNKEKHFAKAEKWRKKNQQLIKGRKKGISARFSSSRYRASKQNREWAITLEEYTAICSQPCAYCDGRFGIVRTGSGLDRLDSARGYTLDNICSCCKHCNQLKMDCHTPEETHAMVQLLIEMRRPKLHVVKETR